MTMLKWGGKDLSCINLFKRKKEASISVFQPLTEKGYVYLCNEISFGKEGRLITPDGNIVIKWSYTYRDGLSTQVKRLEPYRILFDYYEGNCFINDDKMSVTYCFSKLRDRLESLRNQMKASPLINTYDILEDIINDYMKEVSFGN